MSHFECQICKTKFQISDEVLKKYPNWKPKYCQTHKNGIIEDNSGSLLEQAKRKYSDGPTTGVFTDGGSVPNPGPGGWAAIWVEDNKIVKELSGGEENTTNNRMELTGLINALKMLPPDLEINIYSDSQLCCNTLNLWMAGWKSRGWKKKDGEIKNLDLVKELDQISSQRPKAKVNWIKAHSGNLWNEYADLVAGSKIKK